MSLGADKTQVMSFDEGFTFLGEYFGPKYPAVLTDLGVEPAGSAGRFGQGVVSYFLLAPCVFGLMLIAVSIWGKTSHPIEEAITRHPSPAIVTMRSSSFIPSSFARRFG